MAKSHLKPAPSPTFLSKDLCLLIRSRHGKAPPSLLYSVLFRSLWGCRISLASLLHCGPLLLTMHWLHAALKDISLATVQILELALIYNPTLNLVGIMLLASAVTNRVLLWLALSRQTDEAKDCWKSVLHGNSQDSRGLRISPSNYTWFRGVPSSWSCQGQVGWSNFRS